MAVVTTFRARSGKGICVGFLPMPDGTFKTYRREGRKALVSILRQWKTECETMRKVIERVVRITHPDGGSFNP